MSIELVVTLPPGPIDPAAFTRLLEVVIGPHESIRPIRHGPGDPRESGGNEDIVDAIRGWLIDEGVSFAGRLGLGHVDVHADRFRLSYAGYVRVAGDWAHFISPIADRTGSVPELMAVLRSPLAFAATSEAVAVFSQPTIERRHFPMTLSVPTAGSYSPCLDHPHWKMWLGPEWTEFLGSRLLAKAPALVSRPEGAGWFVQIHRAAEEWNSPTGIEAVGRFAAAFGRKVFRHPFQPVHVPVRSPDFSSLMDAAKARYPYLKPR